MKKLLLPILTLMITSHSYGQVDSMSLKTGPLILQARDVEYLNEMLGNQDIFQQFTDTVSQLFNAANKPSGNTSIRIDRVRVGTLVLMSAALRGLPYATSHYVYSRVDAAIRACNNPFLLNSLTALDKKEDDIYNNLRQQGKRKLIRGL